MHDITQEEKEFIVAHSFRVHEHLAPCFWACSEVVHRGTQAAHLTAVRKLREIERRQDKMPLVTHFLKPGRTPKASSIAPNQRPSLSFMSLWDTFFI